MSSGFIRLQACRRALAVVVGLGFLMGTQLGHVSFLESEHSVDHLCLHHTCGILTPVLTFPPVAGLLWFMPVVPVILLPGHAVVVLRPPRLRTY